MSFRAVFRGSLIVAALCCSCGGRINEVTLAKSPIGVGPQWTEIVLPKSVVAKWDAQMVYATLDNGAEPTDHPPALKAKNGVLFTPQFDLISDQGINYVLSPGGFRLGDDVEVFFNGDNVPRGTHFVRLRMRSSQPVTLGPIEWFSYMPEGTKTGEP